MMTLKNNIKYNCRRIKDTLRSIYLCVRFPFLYPRNRWTGLHYNNWEIIDKLKYLYNEAYMIGDASNGYKRLVVNKKKALWYRILKWYHDNFLQWIHIIPEYNELDMGMEDGWKKAFGIQMCKEIKKALLEAGGRTALYNYRITDIKEKYGSLVWSDHGAPKEVRKIIEKYEYISARTCIDCGKTADGMTEGYVLPYCDDCCKEPMTRYYTKEMPFYDYYNVN